MYDIESGVPGVRLATKSDEGELFALLLMLHAENGLFSLNRDKVVLGIQHATERRGGVIYCIEEDRRVVATLGMSIACDWYSDDEYLLERWNFVHPDYRRSDYGQRLIEQSKWASDWFKAQGKLMPFMCGIISLHRTESKIRLYARRMACVGAFFLYGATPRQDDDVRREMRRIEEARKTRDGNGDRAVVPAVETLIRVSKREAEHVR